jgi:hypothetical protein
MEDTRKSKEISANGQEQRAKAHPKECMNVQFLARVHACVRSLLHSIRHLAREKSLCADRPSAVAERIARMPRKRGTFGHSRAPTPLRNGQKPAEAFSDLQGVSRAAKSFLPHVFGQEVPGSRHLHARGPFGQIKHNSVRTFRASWRTAGHRQDEWQWLSDLSLVRSFHGVVPPCSKSSRQIRSS